MGWQVEVLSPSTEYQHATCIDDDSAGFFPLDSQTHRVPEFWRSLFSLAGVGNIGWRALLPLWSAGRRLIRRKQFDLIYISTAHSALFLLGRLWRVQFGVPYVLDVHDPLYKPGSPYPVWARPRLKHRISRALSRYLEAYVVPAAKGLIAVSPHYIDVLRGRYESKQPAWLRPGLRAVIPFSARLGDLREAANGILTADKKNGAPYRVVYVGAGGPIMKRSFTLFSRALSDCRGRWPQLCEGLRIELFGTMSRWRPGDTRELADIAEAHGIGDLVQEQPRRVSYRRSLEILLQSDGALILGVDDAGYMPSKLFSYALSGKPLLASLHREGPAFAQFLRVPDLGHSLWFAQNGDMPIEDAMRPMESFLRQVQSHRHFDRRTTLEPFLAPAMARRHTELFEACI